VSDEKETLIRSSFYTPSVYFSKSINMIYEIYLQYLKFRSRRKVDVKKNQTMNGFDLKWLCHRQK